MTLSQQIGWGMVHSACFPLPWKGKDSVRKGGAYVEEGGGWYLGKQLCEEEESVPGVSH